VRGGGDATAWLFDSNYLPVAHNDDMNEDSKDANVEVASLRKTGDYYVVFRDKKKDSSTLKVAVAKVNLPANAPSTDAVGAAYEALLQAGTLAAHEVVPSGLPFLPQGLYNRWQTDVGQIAGLEVAVYGVDVAGQNIWLVRRYVPGTGVELAAYVAVGAMLGVAGGDDEHIDSWQF